MEDNSDKEKKTRVTFFFMRSIYEFTLVLNLGYAHESNKIK